MMNSLAPTYLTSLVPQPVCNLSRYNLRNSNDLQFINAKTNQYYYSFLPSTVRACNNLPEEIKQSASVQCFKNSLKNHRQPQIPKYYYVGSRRAQVFHTRLRTNCSSFLHLFLKILLTHHCVGVAALRTQNIFFLYCRYYQDQNYLFICFLNFQNL